MRDHGQVGMGERAIDVIDPVREFVQTEPAGRGWRSNSATTLGAVMVEALKDSRCRCC